MRQDDATFLAMCERVGKTVNDKDKRIAELEDALLDLATFAQACAMELPDPGTGVLSAISNANRLLQQSGKR